MSDLELNDLTLTYFPKDRKVVVFSYGNIYQTETNYKIALVLRSMDISDKQEYFLVYINLKDVLAFPIGSVIDNQERTSMYAGEKQLFQIDVFNKKPESKLLYQIPQLNKFIEDYELPKKIGNYNAGFHVKGQWYYVLTDQYTNRTIYIPHYEIARRFYFTSPSMIRQILAGSLEEKSDNLKGLYKSIEDIDPDTKEIVLTQNANRRDAENIYRFATNEESLHAWHQVRRNLSASAIKNRIQKEEKGFTVTNDEMKLSVDFPVKEIIDINARVRELDDGSLLVLKILKEDTSYDFEKLFIKIERHDNKEEPIGVINKQRTNKQNLSGYHTNKRPNVKRHQVEVGVDAEEPEERVGLRDKGLYLHKGTKCATVLKYSLI